MRRYAWINVFSGFLVWGIALAGVSMMMPVMYANISETMNWTVGQTTTFMVIKSSVSAVAGLIAGSLFVRFGLKRVYLPSLWSVGLATVALYFAHDLWVYYALAAISGFGSILCLVAIQLTLARWFDASLGRATGMAMLGGAAAGTVVPLASNYGLQHFGWQATAGAAGVIVLALALVISLLVRESPEPYGYTAEELDPGKAAAHGGPPAARDPGPEFKQILRTRSFYLLVIATAFSGVISNGINEYIPLFIERHTNLGSYMAALGFTIVIVLSGLGKLVFGWMFDRFSTRGVAACWALCGVAVLLTFPLSGLVTFAAFTMVRGLSHGGIVVQAPILGRHIYGVRSIAQLIAILNATFHLGAAAGIGLIGLAVDWTGGFTIPFAVVAVLAFITAGIGLTFKPLHWSGYRAARG
ncbi:MAG: MFS transporter [Sphingomonadales bacterium]|nr:MFS transporter [Sphingomonadales bacterium]MBD3772599.1 MFS transporter [Paracoccaceae bacterium]